jgi:hypothetical protein
MMDVIEAFSANGSDQSLGGGVLPTVSERP